MLAAFEVSAPGKVILHGEHSVVYGQPAIAGVVQVRNTLQLKQRGEGNIEVAFEKLGLIFQLNVERVNALLESLRGDLSTKTLPQDLDHESYSKTIQQFVTENFDSNKFAPREINSITSFVYLLVGVAISKSVPSIPPFDVKLETEMSIGAGLGSSASFGVCLAGAFLFLARSLKDPKFLDQFNKDGEMRQRTLEEVSSWAFCSEKIMHGNPSGLDNTICTFGDVVKFYRGKTPEKISLACPIPVLLIDSMVSRSTATLVQKVVALKEKHPETVQGIFQAMGHIVEDAVTVLKTLKGEQDVELFRELEVLVSMNNNLLRAIGVSHPELEKIFSTAERNGFQAKLSGAGGGGFAMILLVPGARETEGYEKLKRELLQQKFGLIETNLGGVGFEVLPLN